MARVGVGVPVRNGGELLRESLQCLRTQTFEDIEVLIGDNASTDQTAEICAEFAARDKRFRHIRRPENIGAMANFNDLLERTKTDLFIWRAYDDLSDANYVEALVGCFDRDPSIRLAVCDVISRTDDCRRSRTRRYLPPPPRPRILRIAHQLFTSHASWIYGLWHRETLEREQSRVHGRYDHAWGADHLVLFPLILDGQIGGTHETSFLQRILRSGSTRAERLARRPGISAMRLLRSEFAWVCWSEIDAREWTGVERRALAALMPHYIDRRGYSRAG